MMPLTTIYFASLAVLFFFVIYIWRRVTRKFCIIITDKEISSTELEALLIILQVCRPTDAKK